jgi:hypothetical protein
LPKEKKLEYVNENWLKLATSVDEGRLREMNGLVHPLLSKTLSPQGIDEINRHLSPILGRKTVLTGEYHQIMTRLVVGNPDLTPKERVHLTLPSYLMLFEGVYLAEIDFLVYLLLQNGREYYTTGKKGKQSKTLKTYDEIENEFTKQKLLFLDQEGFSAAVAGADRDLRNAIAHLDYALTNDGVLGFNREATETPESLDYEALDMKLGQLYETTLCINRSIRDFYEQWMQDFVSFLSHFDGVKRS